MLTFMENFIKLKKAFICYLCLVRLDELAEIGIFFWEDVSVLSWHAWKREATSSFSICDYRSEDDKSVVCAYMLRIGWDGLVWRSVLLYIRIG